MPPGRTAKIQSMQVATPILSVMELEKLSMDGSIVLRLLTILETPPPITVTNTTQTMHMTIMKQEKMKSVHATVFRPDGMTNASANTANSTHSSV